MIMYHMGLGIPKDEYQQLNTAIKIAPELLAVHTADYEASVYMEQVYEPEEYTAAEFNMFQAGNFKI